MPSRWQRALAILGICASSISFHAVGAQDDVADLHHCPAEEQTPLPVLSFDEQQESPPGGKTILRIAVPSGGLCTLIRITTDGDTGHRHLTPAGRTYDGHAWEAVQPLRLPFECVNLEDKPHCAVEIPRFDQNEEYYLVSYEHTLSREQEISRLLQQTTFGPKLSDIQSMSVSNKSAAQFIEEQMKEPLTLHRAHYRRNTQARLYESYSVGKPRHPCEKHSRWRRFAFTVEDRYKRLTVSSEGPPYLLSVDGFVRTEVMELNTYARASEGVLIPGYDGMMCGKGSSDDSMGGESIRIVDEKQRCRASGMPNPPLQLRESTLLAYNITLITLEEEKLQAVNEERAGRDELINLVDLEDPICADVPSEGSVKPVFSRLRDGSLFMHDPFLKLEDNTPGKPLREGGQWGSVPGVLCPSAPRNLMFEDDCCVLSDSENSCSASGDSGPGSVICQSPGEVANNPLGDTLFDMTRDREADGTGVRTDFEWQRFSLWVMVALNANDQFRQRVAWALYLIIPLEANLVDADTESHTAFFDIFVQHAFGNFRDLLRSIAYSPWMAEMLSFEANKSTDYMYRTEGVWTWPDENFARELVQIFTIGMYALNMDGSPVRDEDGKSVETYDANHVQEFSRAWTGFAFNYPRGNVEAIGRNFIDPLQLKHYRDIFPKGDLYGGFLGDGYPLCNEAPSRAFLRKGATYRLLGKSLTDNSYAYDKRWLYNGDDHLDINPSEDLHAVICDANAGEGCNHQMKVVLDHDVDLALQSNLTKVDTIRFIKVGDMYYEYQPPPCVELAFYNDGKKISFGSQASYSRCANPQSAEAGGACCKDNLLKMYKAFPTCEYTGERITYDHLVDRCDSMGRYVPCDFQKISRNGCGACCNVQHHLWTPEECSILAKINDDGRISIVHRPNEATDVDVKYSSDARNFFRVSWESDAYPSSENECGNGICAMASDGACVCNTSEATQPVLSNLDGIVQMDLSSLQSIFHVGSYDPASYDAGTFMQPKSIFTRDGHEVVVWRPTISARLVEDTTIALPSRGGTKYYKNRESTVQIVDALGHAQYSFRNPPSFGEDIHDAAHETEALLDHLFYHSNTAPFISYRLIQRLGTSNPSPGYIERVAYAFSTGFTTFDGIQFGSGRYGCLRATVAAIILDRELRSVVLDADPSAGSLREPLLAYVHLMRSMEFETERSNAGKLVLLDLEEEIGEMPHGHPSVFSFFLPDYKPPGPIASAGLVAPEATLLTQPYVVGLMKGLVSLVKYGMVQCEGGFGVGPKSSTCLELVEGNYEGSDGRLHYIPTKDDPQSIVDELDLLLTGGRLSERDRQSVSDALAWERDMTKQNDLAHLVRLAQQLIVATPAYHTSSLIDQGLKLSPESTGASSVAKRSSGLRRSPLLDVRNGPGGDEKEYKAVVYLLLIGGNDGYNMFVPLSDCQEKDLYEEYSHVRGKLALNKDRLLPIDVGAGAGQPCSTFGIHPSFPLLAKLFNESEAAIIANSGLLFEPSDAGNYSAIHEATRLFAHDAQRRDIMLANPQGDAFNTGMLGRTVDVLTDYGYSTTSIALDNNADVLNPTPFKSSGVEYINARKPTRFHENPSSPLLESLILRLNNVTTPLGSGMYGQSFSSMLTKAQKSTDFFYDVLSRYESAPTGNRNSDIEEEPVPSTSLGAKLDVVKKLIWARKERKVDRDVFFVTLDGFDMHKELLTRQEVKLGEINSALKGFIAAMKASGIWDSVVIASSSDFGRTLTSNSNAGSDHSWASHHFIAGGSVKGGQVFGHYPQTLEPDGNIILGRGRVVPTTADEAYWNGILEWFGVKDSELDHVLPNRKRTARLFTEEDMFDRNGGTERAN